MHSDVETWITECEMHQEKNTKQSTGSSCEHCPQRTVGISLHGLPDTESVDGRLPAHYGDHIPLQRYSMAILTRNQLARTTAEAFFNHFIMREGIPTRIHADEGANFEYE